MDLEKNIEIAFGVYWKNLPVTTELNTGTHLEAFITGAKSQAAKEYWYNEFQYGEGKDSILKSRAIGITEMPPIKSIVSIADVIPEEIISKQEFLEMHDKAVERSITEETYRESRAWDIKKEKKVSHKRNNKRRK